ncbi:conserved hypothetical protein [Theileria equi strain WA]|uniref:C3H1-type domain-containing protein n=1 Tax=Theileria equi strain WA TaxID=1537102 RepID=L1LGA9_THEEQ|nr:conserved hypothetical protein [Theileria equi strain WA]EKX74188.1 conserved hypothetical protein [Theileria equi strain WA]|eukprot:XP_004833640.1 conserved hypothetical protein [Theileria equi strain WA]
MIISKVKLQNTFLTVHSPEADKDDECQLYKSLSMPPAKEKLHECYIYNIPSFTNQNGCKLSLTTSDRSTADGCSMKQCSAGSPSEDANNDSALNPEQFIPVDENGNLTSIGSIHHNTGNCKPCAFHRHRTKVCENGTRCAFCHFEHAKKRSKSSKNNNNYRC